MYTPIIKMAWIGKKPEFAAKRGTHLVQASCVLRAITEGEQPPLLQKKAGERLEELESIERYKAEQKQKEEERRAKRKKLFSGILGRDEDDGKPPKNRPPEF